MSAPYTQSYPQDLWKDYRQVKVKLHSDSVCLNQEYNRLSEIAHLLTLLMLRMA